VKKKNEAAGGTSNLLPHKKGRALTRASKATRRGPGEKQAEGQLLPLRGKKLKKKKHHHRYGRGETCSKTEVIKIKGRGQGRHRSKQDAGGWVEKKLGEKELYKAKRKGK